MKAIRSGQIRKVGGVPMRVLKSGKSALMLPIPAKVRQRRAVEKWCQRFWELRHKFLLLMDPQYRELMSKTAFSMEKTGLSGMVLNLKLGLFFIWFFTGSVKKAEEFILAVFNGRVFLMNDRRFFPENTSPELPKLDLFKSLLLYDPRCYPGGPGLDRALEATHFLTFLGTPPGVKPWIEQWGSEMEEVRRQAAAELGEELAKPLWDGSSKVKGFGRDDSKANLKNGKVEARVSYW